MLSEKRQEAIMLLHASTSKFGNNVELKASKDGVEEFKTLIANTNINTNKDE